MVQVLVKGEGRPKMENEHPQHEHERGQPSMRRMDDAMKMGAVDQAAGDI